MRILESLYEHWTEHQAEAPEVRQCLIKLDKAVLDVQDERTREDLTKLIGDLCYTVEYTSFSEGFAAGMELSAEIKYILERNIDDEYK